MKRSIVVAIVAFAFLCAGDFFGATPRFEKVSDHCYYLQAAQEGRNIAAVITEEGVLMINPPSEPDLSVVLEALKRLTSKPVRWVVCTDYLISRAGGVRYFVEQGAILLISDQLRQLSSSSPASALKDTGAANQIEGKSKSGDARDEMLPFPRIVFGRQIQIFPADVEVRIFALQHKAHTDGDVVVFVPLEKVLIVGNLYEAACYPDIDVAPGGGNALGWIDGLKQVIDSVPLLKPAIPLPKSETKPGEEKTLEEAVTVITARGERSNLQGMKDLLDASQKLRGELSRAFAAGRTCESFLASPASGPYRSYSNLNAFAAQLFDAISKK